MSASMIENIDMLPKYDNELFQVSFYHIYILGLSYDESIVLQYDRRTPFKKLSNLRELTHNSLLILLYEYDHKFIDNKFNDFLLNIIDNIIDKYLFAKEILNNIEILKFIKDISNINLSILDKVELNEKNNITLINNINNLLDLINYHNFDIDKLLYMILFYWYYKNRSKSLPRIIGAVLTSTGQEADYIKPIYLIYNYVFTYTNYTNITIKEIDKNYLELVDKNNNIKELRNEINVYKTIVNNLITNK